MSDKQTTQMSDILKINSILEQCNKQIIYHPYKQKYLDQKATRIRGLFQNTRKHNDWIIDYE